MTVSTKLHETIVTLKGAKCILVLDEISEIAPAEPALVIEERNERHETLWAPISRVSELRAEYPSLPIYGFWQTILSNQHPDFADAAVLFYEYDKAKKSGAFCGIQGKKAYIADQYLGRLPVSLPSGRHVEIDASVLNQLAPPKHAILLKEELDRIERKRNRSAAIVLGTICLAGVAAAVGADQLLAARAKRLQDETAALDAQTMATQSETATLMAAADPLTPDARLKSYAVLTRFVEILSKMDNPVMTPVGFNTAQNATITVTRLPTDLSFETLFAVKPGEPLTVTFNLDGTAPPAIEAPVTP